MPNWNEVLNEIGEASRTSPIDFVRKKYLKQLHEHTGRNVIAYYSAFLQKNSPQAQALGSIRDDDKNGFMNVIHGMDASKGLDLILHTPGGDIAAVESLVAYLRAKFGTNIRAIIPQMAMSAGTMMACACNTIIMGKQSNLGPFDPQFGGIPAYGVLEEFETAKREILANHTAAVYWGMILQKYHPTFIGECQKAIVWAGEIVEDWLKTGMFLDIDPAEAAIKAKTIVTALNNHDATFAHARHIHIDQIRAIGLNVTALEDDHNLQDLILTVHHSYMHTLSNPLLVKAIENHNGIAMFWSTNESY